MNTPTNSLIHSDLSFLISSPIVESQKPTIDKNKTKAFTSVPSIPIDSLVHSLSPVQTPRQESKPPVPTDIPSSSQNKFFDISLVLVNLSRSDKASSETLFAQILEHPVIIPTNEQLTDLTTHMTQDID